MKISSRSTAFCTDLATFEYVSAKTNQQSWLGIHVAKDRPTQYGFLIDFVGVF